jgi:hypothetical protein
VDAHYNFSRHLFNTHPSTLQAGIIKRGRPVVVGPHVPLHVVNRVRALLLMVEPVPGFANNG